MASSGGTSDQSANVFPTKILFSAKKLPSKGIPLLLVVKIVCTAGEVVYMKHHFTTLNMKQKLQLPVLQNYVCYYRIKVKGRIHIT